MKLTSFILILFSVLILSACVKEDNNYSEDNTALDNAKNLIIAVNNNNNDNACYLVSKKYMSAQECNNDLNNDISVLRTALQNNIVSKNLTQKYKQSQKTQEKQKEAKNKEKQKNSDNKQNSDDSQKKNRKQPSEKIVIVDRNNKRTILTMTYDEGVWKLIKIQKDN